MVNVLILSGMEFQTVGAAKLKALRPMAVVVKRTCSRLCEEQRSLEGALRLTREASYLRSLRDCNTPRLVC